jgi:hypothetical protein
MQSNICTGAYLINLSEQTKKESSIASASMDHCLQSRSRSVNQPLGRKHTYRDHLTTKDTIDM